MNNYKLVIFDMDGTTLDTLEDLADSMNYVLNSNGYPLHTLDEIRSYVGNGIRKLVERAVPKDSSVEEIEEVHKQFVEYYPKHCAIKTKPYAGIPELLATLQERGVHTAVNSNKDDGAVKLLAEQYFGNLLEYSLGTLPDVPKKPAPDGVLCIMEHFNVNREETVYVGDSEVDVQTAKNAGVDAILVDWGFRDRAVLETYRKEAGRDAAYTGTMKLVSSCGELLVLL